MRTLEYLFCVSLLVVFSILALSPLRAVGPDRQHPVRLQRADEMSWDAESGTLRAYGNVFAEWGEHKIYAQELEYSEGVDRFVARRDVRVDFEDGRHISGESLVFYMESGEIEVKDIQAHNPPWFAQAPLLKGDVDTHLTAPRSAFTTCDRDKPHYWVTAGRFHIYPEDRLVGYNAVLWIGRVPVFYFPVFVIDLKDRLSRWSIRPGYSSRDGFMLNLGYRYLMEKDGWPVTGTIYSDFREYAGKGAGIDVEYDREGKYAYLYYFRSRRKPLILDDDDKEVRGGDEEHLWKLKSRLNYNFDDSNWQVHGQADWAGYSRFNKEFDRSLAARTESDRTLKSSAIYRGQNSLFRVDAERRDRLSDSGDEDFERYSARLPGIKYQLFPVNVPWLGRGIYYRLDARANRDYDLESEERLWDLYMHNSLIKSFPWTRWFGQSFRLGYRQKYDEKHIDTEDDNEFQSTGSVELRARNTLRLFPGLSIDAIYNLEQRINRKDEVELELTGTDYGIEKHGRIDHNIDFGLRYDAGAGYLSLRGGYDLRSSDTADINSRDRVYSPRLNFNMPVTSFWSWDQFISYNPQNKKIQQVNTNWKFTLTRNFSTVFGWDYNRRDEQDYSKFKNRLSWESRNEIWQLHTDFVYDLEEDDLEETRLMVYRRLHCWEMRVLYREIHDRDRQIWIAFNLADYPSRVLGFERDIASDDYDLREGRWEEIID